MNSLVLLLFMSLGFNLFLFIPAFYFQTDTLTDISYSLTFGIVALLSFVNNPIQKSSVILLFMILIWSVRIGSFLFIRILQKKKDARFDTMRNLFFPFLRFWMLQGVTVWIILLPSLLYFSSAIKTFSIISLLGICVWFVGFVLETVADVQKFNFNMQRQKEKKWIEEGVWKYSRHPNYLGEILVWIGIYLYAFSTFSTIQKMVGAISPLFITTLLLFISGIPILEKNADKRWGTETKYQAYKKKVGILFPKIF